MSPDPTRDSATEILQADELYQGFPEFSAWGDLTPADIDLWDRFAASLDERRKTATPEALKAAVEVAVRAAALDTGAIEGLYSVDRGFTMTVALQTLAWEQAIAERGAGVRELFEAQLSAYELVLDAVTRSQPISEAWIRALHEKLCAPQQTYRVLTDLGWQEQELPKGQYKTRPNHVRLTDGTLHAYAPVDRVAEEMHRLLEQIRTPEFEAAHPVLQASYCHYALVAIHPFADGNGRVARALASAFFYRALSIPLVVFENQRLAYLESLRTADRGEFESLISFFRNRGVDTMQLVAESLSSTETPDLELAAVRVKKLLGPRKGLSARELDNVALRLLDDLEERIKAQFKCLQLPDAIFLSFEKWQSDSVHLEHHTAGNLMDVCTLTLSKHPHDLKAVRRIEALVSHTIINPFVIRLVAVEDYRDSLDIRLEDAAPDVTPILAMRLDSWARKLLSRLVSELENKGRRQNAR